MIYETSANEQYTSENIGNSSIEYDKENVKFDSLPSVHLLPACLDQDWWTFSDLPEVF
jgi:hypothetical protein